MRTASIAVAALCSLVFLSACGLMTDEPAAPAEPSALRAYFECLMREDEAVVAAHRGGAYPGFPENAIETFVLTTRQGVAVLEVDVARTADGVLILMHDDTLERTTTASGRVAQTDYETVAAAYLEDDDGILTNFRIPTLEDALDWADGRAILELDIKRSAPIEEVAAAVETAGAGARVIFIAYSLDAARQIHRLSPDALISLSLSSIEDLDRAIAAGIDPAVLLAWTGTSEILPDLYAALEARGTPALFGTLGRGDSFDARFAADGDYSEYADLAELGVALIATDLPIEAAQAAAAAGEARCALDLSID